jgi:two-component system, NarL family, sensor histidine kinase DevS
MAAEDRVSELEEERLRRLIDAGRSLVAERDLDRLLERLLAVARELTGARYAAIGVLDEHREALADFIASGIGVETRRAIGDLPEGRGVLGLLISDPEPLRLADVGAHPQSYGFPPGHPRMKTFLGVPIVIRGEAWGNLYLAEKRDGVQFEEGDEEAAVVLAAWAATAVENARLLRELDGRRVELERSVRALEATSEIAQAVGGETQLERVLELIAKRSRALVDAAAVAIVLVEGEELVLAAAAGHIPHGIVGSRVPKAGSIAARILESRHPERVSDLSTQLRSSLRAHGVAVRAGLFVPLRFRGVNVGVIEAFDRRDGPEFLAEDERRLRAAAASAATAVATAQSVERDRVRRTLQGAEEERRRSARELHDQTLQALAALRLQLSAARRRDEVDVWRQTGEEAIQQVDQEIANLRAIIADLRPPALDEIGLAPALDALVDRIRTVRDLNVTADLQLATTNGDARSRLARELETVTYRVIQEALNNAATHADAQQVQVAVLHHGDELEIEVRDDGKGFDPEATTAGFGLAGMRERISLAGGQLQINTGSHGTTLKATLPTERSLHQIPRLGASGQFPHR